MGKFLDRILRRSPKPKIAGDNIDIDAMIRDFVNQKFTNTSINTSMTIPTLLPDTGYYNDSVTSITDNLINESADQYSEILWLAGLVNNRRFIAGGCFRDIFIDQKDKIRDIDIWHLTDEDLQKTITDMTERPEYTEKYRTNNVVAFTHNPTGMTLELITVNTGTPMEILSKFDFTVSKFALFKKNGELQVLRHREYFTHLQERKLVVEAEIVDPDILFNRIAKYITYGFLPTLETKKNLWKAIRKASEWTKFTDLSNNAKYTRVNE